MGSRGRGQRNIRSCHVITLGIRMFTVRPGFRVCRDVQADVTRRGYVSISLSARAYCEFKVAPRIVLQWFYSSLTDCNDLSGAFFYACGNCKDSVTGRSAPAYAIVKGTKLISQHLPVQLGTKLIIQHLAYTATAQACFGDACVWPATVTEQLQRDWG